MSRISQRTTTRILIGVVLLVALVPSTSYTYDLNVRVTDTTVAKSASSGWLTVFLTNPLDSIGGFSLWMQLDRPDLVRFDSIVDTAGTALSGFGFVAVRSPSGQWTDIKLTAFADNVPGGPPQLRGFGPSLSEQALFRVHFHLLSIPDTMQSRTAAVAINSNAAWFSFARPNGTTIGIAYKLEVDTSFFRCIQPQGPDCLQWQQVAGPPYDSIFVRTDTIPFTDTFLVHTVIGSITVAPHCFGRLGAEFDMNGDGVPLSIGDYVSLLKYIIGDSVSIANPFAADMNGDCIINMGDALKLDSLFKFGLPPCDPGPCYFPCACDHTPVRVCCWLSRGNFNGDVNDQVDLADLSTLVTYLTGGQISIRCPEEANVDGVGIINLADLSRLVGYLTGTGTLPAACP
ncbi:MAG: dockerin type I repeat-containing protein [Candidatus Zixiibacteriota bacterium]